MRKVLHIITNIQPSLSDAYCAKRWWVIQLQSSVGIAVRGTRFRKIPEEKRRPAPYAEKGSGHGAYSKSFASELYRRIEAKRHELKIPSCSSWNHPQWPLYTAQSLGGDASSNGKATLYRKSCRGRPHLKICDLYFCRSRRATSIQKRPSHKLRTVQDTM